MLGIYEIHVEGPVDERFVEIFPNMVAVRWPDKTVLRGPVLDGSQLVAMMERLVTTNAMPVLVERVE